MTSADPTRINLRTDPTRQRFVGYSFHGDMPFDMPYITHVEGNLWQGGTESGLVLPTNIRHLISMYPWEKYTIDPEHDLITEAYFPMYDSTEQLMDGVDDIAELVNACLENGPTVVLCQAGLNRSGLVAARSLMLRGWSADEAINLLRTQRSPAVLCNPAFEAWLRRL